METALGLALLLTIRSVQIQNPILHLSNLHVASLLECLGKVGAQMQTVNSRGDVYFLFVFFWMGGGVCAAPTSIFLYCSERATPFSSRQVKSNKTCAANSFLYHFVSSKT